MEKKSALAEGEEISLYSNILWIYQQPTVYMTQCDLSTGLFRFFSLAMSVGPTFSDSKSSARNI